MLQWDILWSTFIGRAPNKVDVMEPFNLKQNDGSLGMDQLGGHEEGLAMLSYGDFHFSTSDFEARVSLSLEYIIN